MHRKLWELLRVTRGASENLGHASPSAPRWQLEIRIQEGRHPGGATERVSLSSDWDPREVFSLSQKPRISLHPAALTGEAWPALLRLR